MSESLKSRIMRWQFNLFPAYRRIGARVTYISGDLKEVQIKLPLNLRTRNYVGTTFGGSMYAAVDPVYMLMFIKLLGPKYIVWDKSAEIYYRRPGTSTLKAKFTIKDKEIDKIVAHLENVDKLDRNYSTQLIDESGKVCADVKKVLHFRKKTKRLDDTEA